MNSREASGSFYCVFIIWLIYSYEENYSICTYTFNTIKLTEAGYGGVGYIINRFARPCSCKFNIHTRHTRVRRTRTYSIANKESHSMAACSSKPSIETFIDLSNPLPLHGG